MRPINERVESVQVVEVVRVILVRGTGKSVEDCVRRVTQYWSPDGTLLAEDVTTPAKDGVA